MTTARTWLQPCWRDLEVVNLPDPENIDKIIERMLQPQEQSNTVPCRYCGANVLVDRPSEQFTLRCPACGQKITLSRGYRQSRGFIASPSKRICPYCDDTGIVEIPEQFDEMTYTFAYRCICSAGQARPEMGIPSVAGMDLAHLLKRRW